MPVGPIQALVFDAKVGGVGSSTASGNYTLIYAAQLQEAEIKLTKRTSGSVRFSFAAGQFSTNTGTELALDVETWIRISPGQTLYIATDELYTPQTVSVIVQSVSTDERIIDLLNQIIMLLSQMVRTGHQQLLAAEDDSLKKRKKIVSRQQQQSNTCDDECDSATESLITRGLKKLT